MAVRTITQTDFSTGELDPRMWGRVDSERYGTALARARNMLIEKSGAIRRRVGWRYHADLGGQVRLVPWQSRSGDLLLALGPSVHIFGADGAEVVDVTGTSWNTSLLPELRWTSDATHLIVTDGAGLPYQITHGGFDAAEPDFQAGDVDTWSVVEMDIAVEELMARFVAPDATLQAEYSGAAGPGETVSLIAPYGTWNADHIGVRLSIKGAGVTVTNVLTSNAAVGLTVDALVDELPTTDWQEQAWSDARGWPVACALHQGRLFVAGTAGKPNGVWGSRSGEIADFGPIGADDDDPFSLELAANEGAGVRHMRSQGAALVLFANGAEFTLSGDPITPTEFSTRRQSSQGIALPPPGEAQGAMVFVRAPVEAGGDQPLILYRYDELAQQFVPQDITLLGQHLISEPVDVAVQQGGPDGNTRVFVLNDDGSIAAVHLPALDRPGVTLLESAQVQPYSIAVLGGRLFAAAEFNGAHRLFSLF